MIWVFELMPCLRSKATKVCVDIDETFLAFKTCLVEVSPLDGSIGPGGSKSIVHADGWPKGARGSEQNSKNKSIE